MAEGVRRLTGSDLSVSVTGLAGPAGDDVHPVGTVVVGVASSAGTVAEERHFTGSRAEVRAQACYSGAVSDQNHRLVGGGRMEVGIAAQARCDFPTHSRKIA